MSRINTRLQKLEALARKHAPDREAILDSVRLWCRFALVMATYRRDEGKEPKDWEALLLDAYDRAPATPGWTPRVIPPGYSGAPDLDPGKVEACIPTWVERFGWPDKPLDVRDVLRGGDASPAG